MDNEFVAWVMAGAKWIFFALVGLLMWNGKRLVKTVDQIEREKVNLDTFNQTVRTFRQDIKDIGTQSRAAHDKLNSRIDDLLKK